MASAGWKWLETLQPGAWLLQHCVTQQMLLPVLPPAVQHTLVHLEHDMLTLLTVCKSEISQSFATAGQAHLLCQSNESSEQSVMVIHVEGEQSCAMCKRYSDAMYVP